MSSSPPANMGRAAKKGTSKTRSRSPTPPRSDSPLGSSSVPSNVQFEKAFLKMLSKNIDDDDEYKSIKLPPFSDGSE